MNTCPRCVMKHLSTSVGLLQEINYPTHRWLVIGQLVLAEWESDVAFRCKIREVRLLVEESLIEKRACVDLVEGLMTQLLATGVLGDYESTVKAVTELKNGKE